MDSISFQSPHLIKQTNEKPKRVKVSMKIKDLDHYQKSAQPVFPSGDWETKVNNTTIESNQSVMSAYLINNLKINNNPKRPLSRQKTELSNTKNFPRSRPKSHIQFTKNKWLTRSNEKINYDPAKLLPGILKKELSNLVNLNF